MFCCLTLLPWAAETRADTEQSVGYALGGYGLRQAPLAFRWVL